MVRLWGAQAEARATGEDYGTSEIGVEWEDGGRYWWDKRDWVCAQ